MQSACEACLHGGARCAGVRCGAAATRKSSNFDAQISSVEFCPISIRAGTGKTLLARAVANRTDACFIRVIGSELVQKYVGEGARMVRELFQMARSKKVCLIFFDEVRVLANFSDVHACLASASLSPNPAASLLPSHESA